MHEEVEPGQVFFKAASAAQQVVAADLLIGGIFGAFFAPEAIQVKFGLTAKPAGS